MKTLHSIKELSHQWQKLNQPVLTIGNFDGIHKGHLTLVKEAKRLSQAYQCPWGVLTFHPHPKEFFSNQSAAYLLSSAQKLCYFASLGATFVCIQPFNESFANTSSDQFFHWLNTDQGHTRHIVVGENFQFGANRSGNLSVLKELCQKVAVRHEIRVTGIPLLKTPAQRSISSTLIRNEVRDTGDMKAVQRMLGRYYAISGFIEKGRQLGRTIGFPTANIGSIEQLIPLMGTYSGYMNWNTSSQPAGFDHTPKRAVIHIGRNPTVTQLNCESAIKVEVHVIDQMAPNLDLYGSHATVFFVSRLRDEQIFPSLDDLKSQITRDCQSTLNSLTTPPKQCQLRPCVS